MALLQPTPPLPPSISLSPPTAHGLPSSSSPSASSLLDSSIPPTPEESSQHLLGSVQATGVRVHLSLEEDQLVLRKVVHSSNKQANDNSSSPKLSPKALLSIPTLHVLSHTLDPLPAASSSTLLLRINYLSSKSKGFNLTQLRLVLASASASSNPSFLARLTDAAYPSRPSVAGRRRRILLVVNPFGGKAGAVKITEKIVKPILDVASWQEEGRVEVQTTHGGHARELAENLDPEAYDAIGVVSGDGVIHEIYNGLAARPDALRCLRIPIVPVPAGSGNGLSISIHGPVDGFSPSWAALNLIKGIPLSMDLCSISQGSRPRLVSFLSTNVGLTAEVDLGTDHLRWMGDARFTYGVVKKSLELATWQGICYIKVDPSTTPTSKAVLARHARATTASSSSSTALEEAGPLVESSSYPDDAAPWLEAATKHEWVRFQSGTAKDKTTKEGSKDVVYVYAGTVSMVSRDFLAFPFVTPGEGFMDVVVQEMTSRTTILRNFLAGETGAHVLDSSMKYYRASALHFIPSTTSQRISIDGEHLDVSDGPFTVECLKGLGRTLGLRGRWEAADNFWEDGREEKVLKVAETY